MYILLKKASNNFHEVTLRKITLYFSYETCIAYSVNGNGIIVSQNEWGVTTGKHLNSIDAGNKKRRIPYLEFIKKLESLLSNL